MTAGRAWRGSRSLRNQLERAALSVSNNIAEGFERGTTNEVLAFLYIAHLKSQISDFKSIAESCSRQLRAWADHLQNSDIKGQRHLNERTRQHYHTKKQQNFRKNSRRNCRRIILCGEVGHE
jgi:four helix bundle protein